VHRGVSDTAVSSFSVGHFCRGIAAWCVDVRAAVVGYDTLPSRCSSSSCRSCAAAGVHEAEVKGEEVLPCELCTIACFVAPAVKCYGVAPAQLTVRHLEKQAGKQGHNTHCSEKRLSRRGPKHPHVALAQA